MNEQNKMSKHLNLFSKLQEINELGISIRMIGEHVDAKAIYVPKTRMIIISTETTIAQLLELINRILISEVANNEL